MVGGCRLPTAHRRLPTGCTAHQAPVIALHETYRLVGVSVMTAPAHIAIFSFAAHGHVNPSLEVIRELVARGHRVTYAIPPAFADKVARTGAEVKPWHSTLPTPDDGPSAWGTTLLDHVEPWRMSGGVPGAGLPEPGRPRPDGHRGTAPVPAAAPAGTRHPACAGSLNTSPRQWTMGEAP